eukprot:CAMPEP_0172619008 /NCGR_PEP_ID=MMETSP1068-20121228/88819_1 /TAXON_ID=35684 /ORGANISM="Pseudopedinella elastica, Strain CCMP716" /LENGTH=165 /DNA_ID=CAMNT_0013425537 /DNA_START=229 /DNA_END=723 /DNA_ORIENTATION=+
MSQGHGDAGRPPPMTSAKGQPGLLPWVWRLEKPAVAAAVAAVARSIVKLAAADETLAVVPAEPAVAQLVELALQLVKPAVSAGAVGLGGGAEHAGGLSRAGIVGVPRFLGGGLLLGDGGLDLVNLFPGLAEALVEVAVGDAKIADIVPELAVGTSVDEDVVGASV